MRFLLDGSAFAFAEQAAEAEFWRRTLPALAARLESHDLFLLNRGNGEAFQEISGAHMLHAPPPDPKAHRVEERRLSRLCRNLSIDAFVSTSCTSAGGKTPSLFVLSRPYPYIEQRDMPFLLARDSAIRSACLCMALDEFGADYLRAGFSLPGQRLRVAPMGDDAAAVELAVAMLSAAQAPLPQSPVPIPWAITKAELIAQFNAPAVRNLYDHLLRIPKVASQLDAFHIVAWHCETYRPQTFLEFGMRNVSLAIMAAEMVPGIEVYGSASAPQLANSIGTAPTFTTAAQLMAIPQTAAARYSICSPAAFLADLAEQSAGSFSVDLAVIRPDPSPEDVLAQMDAVQDYLGPHGALVITGQTPGEFSPVLAAVRANRPNFACFPMKQGTAALAIRAQAT